MDFDSESRIGYRDVLNRIRNWIKSIEHVIQILRILNMIFTISKEARERDNKLLNADRYLRNNL